MYDNLHYHHLKGLAMSLQELKQNVNLIWNEMRDLEEEYANASVSRDEYLAVMEELQNNHDLAIYRLNAAVQVYRGTMDNNGTECPF